MLQDFSTNVMHSHTVGAWVVVVGWGGGGYQHAHTDTQWRQLLHHLLPRLSQLVSAEEVLQACQCVFVCQYVRVCVCMNFVRLHVRVCMCVCVMFHFYQAE